ncbi:FadR/GntR family transcriptional regulator [Mycolicibacterium fortuitum]|jgi:DNA-binding FadR family transcriptional regulator|uniref:GntR family transcriptional regulator n=1 Tax=Mycolicibacterium fortuitum subsp. fortuitum DSM 46621 = ATCC 6841 = JCM 6387 TaxID=1214102 RepID=K0VF88_MYCFO|nr:FCD domain-containing protein [Mycolicibacterium fortuitum]AIY47029.1 Lactate-responsive regulator LldR in Actinobacteria, GntR family [Mycobacterium sp. VKM Ac-1817D]CRL76789.1 GntR family transcriptional regulator [Mycolicibacter nonchromogenicus]EJZ13518.1 GntR family transcriptional regulator [Mycolicibacterium fortuitum subsp. fortuitum DSM 46621 = ATCC 6841 = JCM 6387]MBP3087022.1 FadR family transcriptional regulator [Mycolicibacterium fortuitum]MCA4755031.1 FadR family transcription
MSTAKTALVPVRQIAAHELVVDQMRRALELGQFRPGDRLPTERELSDMLDVSRTTVRAAVAVLEKEGLITVRRGRGGGFTVQAPQYDPAVMRRELRRNKRAIRDAFDYRVIVETGATRLAAERRRATDVTELRKLLKGMESALQVGMDEPSARRTTEFQTLDSAFHLRIAQAAQNDRLLEAVADARRRMWLPVGAIFGRLEPNANDYHESILEAIENRDPESAATQMAAHIDDTRRTVESWLKR